MVTALVLVAPVPEIEIVFTPPITSGSAAIFHVANVEPAVTSPYRLAPKSSITVLYPYSRFIVYVRPAAMVEPVKLITSPVELLVIIKLVIGPTAVMTGYVSALPSYVIAIVD
jgi:hypothetical protein